MGRSNAIALEKLSQWVFLSYRQVFGSINMKNDWHENSKNWIRIGLLLKPLLRAFFENSRVIQSEEIKLADP